MQLLQPFRNTAQVMLEPVSHQKRFAVCGFNDILQSVQLAVVDTDGLAAVIIGEVLFGRLCAGKNLAFAYTLFSVIGGAIIYYIVMNVVLWLKLPSDDLKLFSAIVVAVFLAIPYLKSTHKGKEQ